MRVKDWIGALYVWGEYRETRCVDLSRDSTAEGEDVVVGIPVEQADRLTALTENYAAALWFLYDRADDATKQLFWERINEVGEPSNPTNPRFRIT